MRCSSLQVRLQNNYIGIITSDEKAFFTLADPDRHSFSSICWIVGQIQLIKVGMFSI